MSPTKKNKCMYCNKKQVILLKCDCCNKQYCMTHRMPELHECSADFHNKDQLKKDLGPQIIPIKVDKI